MNCFIWIPKNHVIDYFESQSPVIQEIFTRMIMIISIKDNVKMVIVEITKSFLVDNKVYMFTTNN